MNERALFEAALEIVDPAARQAFLDQECADHADLRARVDALLQSHDSAGSFLEMPLVTQPKTANDLGGGRTVDFTGQIDSSDVSEEDSISLSFLQPSSKPGSIGKLAHYEILKVIGQGGFGIVLKAFDEKLHRLVAIKVMNPQMAATSPPRKRFLREARAAAAIRHENVVQVYSVEEQPLPYLVMEFIDGQTMQEKLDGVGPLETAEVLHIGRQIASGLAAAHATGLIHRDIKPGNIMLEAGPEQKVKITDFGLARAADDASMTRTGTVCGTPMYMAPEQAQGQTLDHRADLFSFGSVLYQMACGRPPFREATTFAVLRRVVEDTPRPLQEIIPEIPTWLAAIVAKLHAKQPNDRFQTAKEVADLLARCQTEWTLNGKVGTIPGLELQKVPAAAKTPAEVNGRSSASAPSRGKWWVIAATVLALAGFVGAEMSGLTKLTGFASRPNESAPVEDNAVTEVPSGNTNATPTSVVGWHGWPADAPPPAIAPFDAAQAKQHQEAWAAYLKVPVEYTNTIGMKFRLIPPGEFMMGSTPEEIEEALQEISSDDQHFQECIQSEGPQHPVILTQPFYLGVNEVTQGNYEKVIGTNPSYFAATGNGNAAVAGMETTAYPVETVS